MLATKKKGYALIYAICAVMIIGALMLAILSLSLSNRTTTAYYQKSNKARLLAEEGMESAVNVLKTNVAVNFTEYINAQESGTLFTLPNQSPVIPNNTDGYSYSFAQALNHLDNTSGKRVNCIEILSTGTFQNITKTITAYIAENDISNIYYDKMFTHPVTQDANIPSIDIKPTDNDDAGNTAGFEKYTGGSGTTNPYMVTMKRDISLEPGITLKSLTDTMYNYITTDPSFNTIDVSAEMRTLENNASVSDYLGSITNNGSNYVQDMLKFSTFYKVIFVHIPKEDRATVSLNVGTMSEPLVNYIIYCDGKINVTNGSNLKLWNCNIYANGITYNGHPTKISYAENATDVTNVIDTTTGNDVSSQFDIEGIGSTNAKQKILQHLLAYDATDPNNPNNPYNALKSEYENQIPKNEPESIFSNTNLAGKFTEANRVQADTNFYSYLDGYAYGLKLRYVDIKFN
ncbi:hypothetical protein [Clostridium akagii]|uniref:hypothetical protein n=1 Tax=Clostridium akagii TaxID=91623 RepID=UPI00047EA5E8|nr:hypothetical protein [Clostridium akagii]